MTADSRLSRAVPFPEWGPDLMLRFTTRDLCDLELYTLGIDPTGSKKPVGEQLAEILSQRLKTSWADIAERLLDKVDAGFVREAVRVGLKKPGGIDHVKPSAEELDDLPFAPGAVVQKISDALFCAVSGVAYATVVQDREAKAAHLAEAAE